MIPLILAILLLLPADTVLADTEKIGTTFTVGIQCYKTLDLYPLDPQERDMLSVYDIIYNSLVTIDDNYFPEGCIAQSWEYGSGGKVWTFHLRPGLTWSNGQPITADDLVYSWQRLADPKTASPYQSYISAVHLLNADAVMSGKLPPSALGVKAIDPQTFQVTLSQPVSWFLQAAASPSFFWYGTSPQFLISSLYAEALSATASP